MNENSKWKYNDEANTFVAKSASKLAAVEDEGPRWPGVSPKASATLAALRLTKLRINSPSKTYSDVSTLTEIKLKTGIDRQIKYTCIIRLETVKSFVVLHYTHMYYNTKSRRGANIWVTTRRKRLRRKTEIHFARPMDRRDRSVVTYSESSRDTPGA
uniref:Uncharacterized protein n=1 Tax=Trichogramma kaykai TaxID=54128 RepID=A0ABD2WIG9_9HYME